MSDYSKITYFHIFFSEKDLISPRQSGFRPGDSCTNQLLSITHEILSAFDDGHEVSGVFLDVSNAFDRVWHEGLLFRLEQNGISEELITLKKYFLNCRKQRVVLNGQHLSWADDTSQFFVVDNNSANGK